MDEYRRVVIFAGVEKYRRACREDNHPVLCRDDIGDDSIKP